MTDNGRSPTWPMLTKWLVGVTGTLLTAICAFLAHQVLVVNTETNLRQDKALVESKATLDAVKEYELRSLRYEINRLSVAIDTQGIRVSEALNKLEERLRRQEMKQ